MHGESRCECCGKTVDVRFRPDADVDLCDDCYEQLRTDCTYDSSQPISIFNHPQFGSMTLRDFEELEDSWP